MGSDAWDRTRHGAQALGAWLRSERQRRNLFLLDVAEPLGIDKPTLSRIERGELVPSKELGEQLTIWVLQQPESDDIPHARTTDPETSHEAAASVREITITATRLAILRYLDHYAEMDYYQRDIYGSSVAEKCIDEGIAAHLASIDHKCSRSGVSTRRLELQRAGLVEDSGALGVTNGGRRAIAWRITDEGKEALHELEDQ